MCMFLLAVIKDFEDSSYRELTEFPLRKFSLYNLQTSACELEWICVWLGNPAARGDRATWALKLLSGPCATWRRAVLHGSYLSEVGEVTDWLLTGRSRLDLDKFYLGA